MSQVRKWEFQPSVNYAGLRLVLFPQNPADHPPPLVKVYLDHANGIREGFKNKKVENSTKGPTPSSPLSGKILIG